MSTDERMNHDISAVESMLARLSPVDSRVDRDRLMFDLGAASTQTARNPALGWYRLLLGILVASNVTSLGLVVPWTNSSNSVPISAPAPTAIINTPAEPAMNSMATIETPTPGALDRWLMALADPNDRLLNTLSREQWLDPSQPVVVDTRRIPHKETQPDDADPIQRARRERDRLLESLN
jgi:hypothetical protein